MDQIAADIAGDGGIKTWNAKFAFGIEDPCPGGTGVKYPAARPPPSTAQAICH